MSKNRLGLFLLAGCLFLLAGCTPSGKKKTEEAADPGNRLLLGFAQIGSESSWRIGNTRSVQEAAGRHGIQLMMSDANQKQENEIRAIRQFIAYQVDVIAFVPIVEEGWENVLYEARNAGIPVILSDRQISDKIDENLYTTYVGADFYAEGQKAGEFLRKKAENSEKETFRIVELLGTPFRFLNPFPVTSFAPRERKAWKSFLKSGATGLMCFIPTMTE